MAVAVIDRRQMGLAREEGYIVDHGNMKKKKEFTFGKLKTCLLTVQ